MSDIGKWLSECRAALAQAERLSAGLSRLGGSEQLQLAKLRRRIADLRSAIDTLDALRAAIGDPGPAESHPEWMGICDPTPWCAPASRGQAGAVPPAK